MLRKYFTRKYTSGIVAVGERFSRFEAIGPEWILVDTKDCDKSINFSKNSVLPFADASVNILYSTHMIEHLSPPALERFVAECFRVLKPGGYLRFEAPDAEKLVNAYINRDQQMIDVLMDSELINQDRKYGEVHAGILGVLSCFIVDGKHVPVYVPEDIFAEKVSKSNLVELEGWLQELQTEEQKQTNGHNCLVYFSKLNDLCLKNNADACWEAAYNVTKVPGLYLNNVYRRHKDAIIEGYHRVIYSIYFEARKIACQ